MKVIDYEKAFDPIMELYLKFGNRVEAEQGYLASLQALEAPKDGELYRKHENLASMYLARGTGVWEAMQILTQLREEQEEVERDKEVYRVLRQLVDMYVKF